MNLKLQKLFCFHALENKIFFVENNWHHQFRLRSDFDKVREDQDFSMR